MKKQTGDIEIDCLNFDRPKLIQHKKSIRLINCRWRGCGSWKIKRRRIRRGRWRIRRKKDYGYVGKEKCIKRMKNRNEKRKKKQKKKKQRQQRKISRIRTSNRFKTVSRWLIPLLSSEERKKRWNATSNLTPSYLMIRSFLVIFNLAVILR